MSITQQNRRTLHAEPAFYRIQGRALSGVMRLQNPFLVCVCLTSHDLTKLHFNISFPYLY